MDRFPEMLKGTRVHIVHRGGAVIRGVVNEDVLPFQSNLSLEGKIRLNRDGIDSIQILNQPLPPDNYPLGTVVRWAFPDGSPREYRTAVKRGDGPALWWDGLRWLNWSTLLLHRPLVVLAESQTLEAPNITPAPEW